MFAKGEAHRKRSVTGSQNTSSDSLSYKDRVHPGPFGQCMNKLTEIMQGMQTSPWNDLLPGYEAVVDFIYFARLWACGRAR